MDDANTPPETCRRLQQEAADERREREAAATELDRRLAELDPTWRGSDREKG